MRAEEKTRPCLDCPDSTRILRGMNAAAEFATFDALVSSLEAAGLLSKDASFEEFEAVVAALETSKFDQEEPS
jgi:hypothetical protein